MEPKPFAHQPAAPRVMPHQTKHERLKLLGEARFCVHLAYCHYTLFVVAYPAMKHRLAGKEDRRSDKSIHPANPLF